MTTGSHKKRVLVTGASGQLGKSLRDLEGDFPELEFEFLNRTELDITRKDVVEQSFVKYNPDYCINCAAFTQVDLAEKNPEGAYAVNVKGVQHLVDACKKSDTTLIHISTDYVFDGLKPGGYTPSDVPNPINEYGRTKLQGEQEITDVLQRYFIIRTSWLYSRKYGPNFYLTVRDKARKSENLNIIDSQRGCPTDATNLSRHILELITSGSTSYGISHFTDATPMTWFEFAGWILEQEGLAPYEKLQKAENYRTFAVRPTNSILLH